MANPPDSMNPQLFVEAVDHVIRQRKTAKILRSPDDCTPQSQADQAAFMALVQASIDVAGWAPFHKAAHKKSHLKGDLTSIVPWRFYVLEQTNCCAVVAHLRKQAEQKAGKMWEKAWDSKIPKLLAGAGALVLVTWLPNPPEDDERDSTQPELTTENVEHIAAASAATQNLMLAAEARGLQTYWSSGGVLGSTEMLAWLGIATNQKLLGAIFLGPSSAKAESSDGGGLRHERGKTSDWCAIIDKRE
jgi:nitroreductase